MPEKIEPRNLRIEKLHPGHQHALSSFQTSTKELGDFLVEDALKNQDLALSATYLWFTKDTDILIAYITLLCDSLRIRETGLEKDFVAKGVFYKARPALKVGRLCVTDNFTHRGIGTQLMYFAMEAVLTLSQYAGCRFIVVDAKKDVLPFYTNMEFQTLKDEEKETIPMYFDMFQLIERQKQGKLKLPVSGFWKTPL